MGEMLAGRYELIDLIDSGGTGAVWRIWDHRAGMLRAGKILRQSDADALLRFVRETSRRIEHSHVVAPDGWYGEDGRVMLTMPLVGGGSLATLMRDFGPLPLGWGVEALRQVLQGLTAVHEVGLVHRDVKPANILLEPTGQGHPVMRLADFGTSAAVDSPRMTQVGFVIGTPGFMAPEQARGADPDPRQDLYAAAVTVTLALTGQRADPDGTPPRLDVPQLAGPTGSALAGLLAMMLAPDPAARPATAHQALQLLDRVPGAHDLGLGTDPENPVEVFDQLGPLPEEFAGRVPSAPAPPADSADHAHRGHAENGPTRDGSTKELPGTPVTTPAPAQVFPQPSPAWAAPATANQPRWDPGFVAAPPAGPAPGADGPGRPGRIPVLTWVLLGFGLLCVAGAGVLLVV